MMTEEALSKIGEGMIEVLVDNEESALNVSGYAAQNGMYAETKKEGKDWQVKVVKGYTCKVQSSETSVQSDRLKRERHCCSSSVPTAWARMKSWGRKLMKGFFDTMKVHKQLPHTIFFLNAGVKLTTVNEEIAGVLKEIEALGVEIYSCGTCLKHYGLESALKVGNRGTTNHIVEGMQDFDKVVWV